MEVMPLTRNRLRLASKTASPLSRGEQRYVTDDRTPEVLDGWRRAGARRQAAGIERPLSAERGSSGGDSVRGCLRRREGEAAALLGAGEKIASHGARIRLRADQAAFHTRSLS